MGGSNKTAIDISNNPTIIVSLNPKSFIILLIKLSIKEYDRICTMKSNEAVSTFRSKLVTK